MYNIIHHILVFFKNISYSLPVFHFHVFVKLRSRSRSQVGAEIQALPICWLIPSLLALETLGTPHHSKEGTSLACNEGIFHVAISVVVTQVLIVTTLPLHSQSSKG